MKGSSPYIMPDGKPLTHYLSDKREDTSQRGNRRQGRQRGKDELWQQLQSHAARRGQTDYEATELHVLQAVGNRRRRRWMNDKTLRDMAGSMTAVDMEAQFNPVPFGGPTRSTLSDAVEQVGQQLWDRLRSISWDKQAAVLQRWEQHIHDAQAHNRRGADCPAARALQKWAQVERKARCALRQANIHSVLELEAMVLDYLEQDEGEGALVLQTPDSFARLLGHGLAAFHGLRSCSLLDPNGNKMVQLSHRPPPKTSSSTAGDDSTDQGPNPCAESSFRLEIDSTVNTHPAQREDKGHDVSDEEGRRAWVHGVDELTCTDVLMAAQALGPTGSLSLQALDQYMRTHLHGLEQDVTCVQAVQVACLA